MAKLEDWKKKKKEGPTERIYLQLQTGAPQRREGKRVGGVN